MSGESIAPKVTTPLAACLLLFLCGHALGQTTSPEREPVAVVEVGGAGSKGLRGGGASFGPGVAVEVTPIENWLELEAGVSPFITRHSTEWDTDLLFKKPWTLSPRAEFMFGVGPEWIRTRASGITSNAVAGEAVLDFMFWPPHKRRFGWYLEPAYEYSFASGHERSIGLSGGLLIAVW